MSVAPDGAHRCGLWGGRPQGPGSGGRQRPGGPSGLNRAEQQSFGFENQWVCPQGDLESIKEVDIAAVVNETVYCLVSLWFTFVWLYGWFS